MMLICKAVDDIDNIKRLPGEEFEDYFVRLFENKKLYGLNCDQIAELLNAEDGVDYGESCWRKKWTSFNQGREYERKKQTSGIANRILALSDFHFPFQLPVETFSDYVGAVDTLVLNGDLVDMKEISRFAREYRQSPMDEIIGCRQYMLELIEFIRPKKVVVTYGNHDQRFARYLAKNLDTDLIELMPETPLELIFEDGFNHYNKAERTKVWYEPLCNVIDGVEIEYTHDWNAKVGKTIFAHPSAYSSGMLKTTEKAVNYFYRKDRDFNACILAHTHKLGSFIQGDVCMFEQGACCYVEKMKYHDGGLVYPQQKGFLYLCQDAEGNLLFDKCKTVNL